MLLFIVSSVCATAVLFAGFPAALNEANKIHILNDREPNAGIAFMPELIVIIILWWLGALGVKYIFGLTIALVAIVCISLIMFLWQVYRMRRSNRDYADFIAAHSRSSDEGALDQE